jgi:hypothetical protein
VSTSVDTLGRGVVESAGRQGISFCFCLLGGGPLDG